MKVFVFLFALVAASLASDDSYAEVDWSNVVPIRDMPGFWKNKSPLLTANTKNSYFGRDRRVVNGEIATPHQFPYQAGLLITMTGGTALCGGSLIARRTVLTAAHCIDATSSVLVVLGAQFLTQIEPNQQRVTVNILENIVIHENWTPDLIRNDVGVLLFTAPVTLNPFVQPINLASGTRDFENEGATVSGWGRPSDSAPGSSDVLRFYRGTILPMTNCRARFPGIIQDNNICLSGLNNGGACSGDSGGPLTYTEPSGASLHIGIVSFGLAAGCETPWPSVFARTTSFNDWIAAWTLD